MKKTQSKRQILPKDCFFCLNMSKYKQESILFQFTAGGGLDQSVMMSSVYGRTYNVKI